MPENSDESLLSVHTHGLSTVMSTHSGDANASDIFSAFLFAYDFGSTSQNTSTRTVITAVEMPAPLLPNMLTKMSVLTDEAAMFTMLLPMSTAVSTSSKRFASSSAFAAFLFPCDS